MTDKCYSFNDEIFSTDFSDLLDGDPSVGDIYYEGDKVPFTAESIVSKWDINNLFELLDDRTFEEVGELNSYPFENVSEESAEELRQLIIDWVNKHKLLDDYYRITNVVEKKFTKEDLE